MNTSTNRRAKTRHSDGLYKAIKKSGITPDAAHDLDASIRETVGTEVGILREEMKELLKNVATKDDILVLKAGILALQTDMHALESRLLVKLLAGIAALMTIAVVIAGFIVYLLR